MSRITVRMYTTLKEKVGTGDVELEAKNVQEALEGLNKKFGENFRQTLYEPDGKIKGYYILLLNGKVVDREKPEKFKLKSGDTLHIFPPIAGG
ncbi:MAG: MoaD family protein [Elusimicrobiota bacterium]|nr:MoaD family protein [Elusimicrobiota bacterium]